MNIPNLDFEISLIKGFWNAPSKIDWYHSIPQEGTISIIVSVVLLIIILVHYADYECGLNCKPRSPGADVFVCKKTLR